MAKAPLPVSPLAPKGGFPELPRIDGVRFASGAAGVRYQNRTDVMLVEICAGASVAGVFTRSSTRSAPVLDCESKLAALAESIEFKERDTIGWLPRSDRLIEDPHLWRATTTHTVVHLGQPRVHTCAVGVKRGFGLVILRLNAR